MSKQGLSRSIARAANRFGVTPTDHRRLQFAVTSPVAVYSPPGSMLSLIWLAAFPHCNPDAAWMAHLWPDDAAWTSLRLSLPFLEPTHVNVAILS